jgi:hypothetical protein
MKQNEQTVLTPEQLTGVILLPFLVLFMIFSIVRALMGLMGGIKNQW